MSIIIKELERRNDLLLKFDEKVQERKTLIERLEFLNKELDEFDKETLVAEIDELTECGIRLGLLQAPIQEDVEQTDNCFRDETENIVEEGV